ncbi:hypothetical protein [Arsenophonus nasoniae]|uniref:hypothetical protein n=1 Tax=Arsenophonus nasoniae TaxID=638 RepID=UPI003879038B
MKSAATLRLIGNPHAYYPNLAKPLGGLTSVILFSQIFYWQDKANSELGVYKTRADLEEETGLTHDEQRTAIKKLVSIGVLIVTEKRLEHKTYYRIDEEKLNEILDNFANSKKGFSRDGESGAPEVDIVEFGESTLSSSFDQEITTKITTIDPSIISLTKKSKVFDPSSVELPNWLSRSTWHSWLQYRKEINKPIKSPMTVTQAIKLLSKCRDDGYSPEDIINTSIANGWQGLFEPKDIQSQKSRYRFKEIAKMDVFITDDF